MSPDDVYCPRCGYYLRRYELALLQFNTSLDRELSKLRASKATSIRRSSGAGKLVMLVLLGVLSIVLLYYLLNMFTPTRLLSSTGLRLAAYHATFGQPSTSILQPSGAEKILRSLTELLNRTTGGSEAANVNLPIVHADAKAYCTRASPHYYLLTLILDIRNMLPLKLSIRKLVIELLHGSYPIRRLVVSGIVIGPDREYRVVVNTKVGRCYRKLRLKLSYLMSIYGMTCTYQQVLVVSVT